MVELVTGRQPADRRRRLPSPRTAGEQGKWGRRGERTPGGAGAIPDHHQASADPGRVTCGESAPSPGLSALHADRTPPARGSRSPPGLRGPSAAAPGSPPRLRGPSASNWLQPAAATEWGSRWREGPGRGGASGQAQGSRDRKVLPNTVGLLRLLLNGSGPGGGGGGGGGSDIPGERSRRRRLLLHSLLASSRRAPPAPRPFSHLPPPSPTHTPRALEPYSSGCRVTHPPARPPPAAAPSLPPSPPPAAAPGSVMAATRAPSR
ncbi:uncharacterized protein LOC144321349 [Canis aureus]